MYRAAAATHYFIKNEIMKASYSRRQRNKVGKAVFGKQLFLIPKNYTYGFYHKPEYIPKG